MLLCYKAWRESHGPFLIAAIVLVAYCFSFVERARFDFPPRLDPFMPYSTFVWHAIYSGPTAPIFIVISFALGLGGLHRERAAGSLGFTLALPVTRTRLVITRGLVGLLEIAILAAIPSIIVPSLSPIYAAQSYPLGAALRFALLFFCAGAVWVSAGVLTATLFFDEHSGITAAVLVPAAYGIALKTLPLQRFPSVNLVNVMTGAQMPHFDAGTSFFVGPLPWATLLGTVMLSIGLMSAATYVTEQQDF